MDSMTFPTENLIVLVIVSLIVLAIVAYLIFSSAKSARFTSVKIGNATVNAEVADTFARQIRGLMFRKSLDENDGMLFTFSSEGYQGIWMMNMSFPIDIIWINSTKGVVSIQKNAQPCTLTSCPTYKPSGPAMFVLEVNAGFCGKHNIKVGSKADFDI
jgi:hypothetical protein